MRSAASACLCDELPKSPDKHMQHRWRNRASVTAKTTGLVERRNNTTRIITLDMSDVLEFYANSVACSSVSNNGEYGAEMRSRAIQKRNEASKRMYEEKRVSLVGWESSRADNSRGGTKRER